MVKKSKILIVFLAVIAVMLIAGVGFILTHNSTASAASSANCPCGGQTLNCDPTNCPMQSQTAGSPCVNCPMMSGGNCPMMSGR